MSRVALILAALLLACSRPQPPADDAGTTTNTSSTTSGSESDPSETMGDFVPSVDLGSPAPPSCSVLEQDCPEGEKCVPDGAAQDYKCVPVVGDQQPGEPCVFLDEEDPIDNCDETSACWWDGVCLTFCTGTPDELECPNLPGCDDSGCLVAGEYSYLLCYSLGCDPLAQDCGENMACNWHSISFQCNDLSANLPIGQPCEYVHECVAGAGCVAAELLPSCEGVSCCAPYCDPAAMADPCPNLLPGTSCMPFDEAIAEQPGCVVGRCLIP